MHGNGIVCPLLRQSTAREARARHAQWCSPGHAHSFALNKTMNLDVARHMACAYAHLFCQAVVNIIYGGILFFFQNLSKVTE